MKSFHSRYSPSTVMSNTFSVLLAHRPASVVQSILNLSNQTLLFKSNIGLFANPVCA